MADVSYSREFTHEDWIDNEDVVQAGGEKGFNKKFHEIEDEFDKVSNAVSLINTEIKNIQRLKFVQSEAPLTLGANSVSTEFLIEQYDRASMPEFVEKAYFVAIFPVSGTTHVQHSILYRELPGNKIAASIQFYNPGATQSRFSFRIMTLAVQGA